MSAPIVFTQFQRAARDQAAGFFTMLWRRQGGKTTTFAALALLSMARVPGRLVTFASASLLVGREVIQKEAVLFRDLMMRSSTEANPVKLVDTRNELVPTRDDDLTDAFESGRLESRLWHDRTVYSRTQVIAPSPATARGFTGDVFIDEIGAIADLRELLSAMEPISSRDPTFRCRMALTPPESDEHYSHELLCPPAGTLFPVNPAGNWYTSEMGELVHRVDIYDAAAAGVKLYSRKGDRREVTPEEHRAESTDRDAHDLNYSLLFAKGGTAVCSLVHMRLAQEHPESVRCLAAEYDLPGDFEDMVGPGKVTLGLDLATTQNETSNPSALSVVEDDGLFFVRLILRWKTEDPEVTRAILRAVVNRLGGKARALGIDATNERFFAKDVATVMRGLIPVELVISSETLLVDGKPMKLKNYMGNLLQSSLQDGKLVLPPDGWVKTDFRLARKDGPDFYNLLDSSGNHGDTFDSTKIALHMQTRREQGRFVAYQRPNRAARAFADRRERSCVG